MQNISGAQLSFLTYNGFDKNDNQIELHLLQTFRNDQNLNNNKNNTNSYFKTNQKNLFNKNCTKICPTPENAGVFKILK